MKTPNLKSTMPYVGPIADLAMAAEKVTEMWVVRLNLNHGLQLPAAFVTLTFGKNGKDAFHTTAAYARRALINHIYANLWQGNYWHKNKINTFAMEQGLSRNSGHVVTIKKEFEEMAPRLTQWLLDEEIFKIERITL